MKKVNYIVKEVGTDIEFETYDSKDEALNSIAEMNVADIEAGFGPGEYYIDTEVKYECDYCGEETEGSYFCSKECARQYQLDN